MNTPEPCCRCLNCGYDIMREDDPTDEAYCKLKHYHIWWGNSKCPMFVHWETKKPLPGEETNR
jgi:hypothetical protein